MGGPIGEHFPPVEGLIGVTLPLGKIHDDPVEHGPML